MGATAMPERHSSALLVVSGKYISLLRFRHSACFLNFSTLEASSDPVLAAEFKHN